RDAACALFPPVPMDDVSPTTPAHSDRLLALGYLVDFTLPFVADLIAALATFRDQARVDMTVYAVSPIEPALLEALLVTGIRVVQVATFDEQRTAQTIRSENPDILIDAASFGPYAKPGILSYRPARIQVTMPGFDSPLGVGELDFRLSDRVVDLDLDRRQGEPLAIFVDGGVFPLLPAPQVHSQVTRPQLGIAQGAPVYGILASVARVSMRCLMLWKELSERVPNAVFFVCPMQTADREPVKRMLVANGIEAARIVMLPPSLQRLRELSLSGIVDIILDTMPGSDYFSARASILNAIPLVTMPGRMFEERVALSLLTRVGGVALVADSGRDYVNLAAKMATDPAAVREAAAKLSALLQTSEIGNMGKYVANVEDALFRAAQSITTTESAR
ncbi:MAG: hypothetical protein ABI583_05030, partial [Betaproteobacteria bacterium]